MEATIISYFAQFIQYETPVKNVYSFLLSIDIVPKAQRHQNHVNAAIEIIRKLGHDEQVLIHRFLALEDGHICITEIFPADSTAKKLIHTCVRENANYILWGELYEQSKGFAELLANVWEKDGQEQARQLEGSYAGIRIEKGNNVTIVTDLLGRRSLRYYKTADGIFISSHDVFLAQLSHHSWEVDYAAIASTVLFGWSLGGRSFLQGIEITHPNKVVHWNKKEGVKTEFKPILLKTERIDAKDKKSIKATIENIQERLKINLSVIASPYASVEIFLTAGLDSRAVAALATAVLAKDKLCAVTDGESGVLDVDVAKSIARRIGIPHKIRQAKTPDFNNVLQHLYLLAFAMNGDTAAARALAPYPSFSSTDTIRLYGTGGEIFRGYYYAGRTNRQLCILSTQETYEQLSRKYIEKMAFASSLSSSTLDTIKSHLWDIIDELKQLSPQGADILDLFYLHERYCRWGAMGMHFTWYNQYSPFDSPAAVRLGYQLPIPIAQNALLFKEIIRKNLPRELWTPINNKDILPIYSNSIGYKGIVKLLHYANEVLDTQKEEGKSKGDVRNNAFQEFLKGGLLEELPIHNLAASIVKNNKAKHNLPINIQMRLMTVTAFLAQVKS
ncbi:MAG TPA: asparagine synthase-related protein [Saprospiraceae bacterium]|nr:asparagine synthase-related protein [Saprospiraceae bacterium]